VSRPIEPGLPGEPGARELPAPIEEQVNAALDVCEDLVGEVVPALITRLDKIEKALAPAAPGETRSDYRIENWPPPRSVGDVIEQIERAVQAWQRLAGWVDWLVATYRLTMVIPACWSEHPALVEELVSLRISWVGAWLDAAPPDAPAGWQRRLSDTKIRLADGNWGVPRCNGEHHESGLDQPETYFDWRDKAQHATSLATARERMLRVILDSARGTGLSAREILHNIPRDYQDIVRGVLVSAAPNLASAGGER
jgi:hypothetical protein